MAGRESRLKVPTPPPLGFLTPVIIEPNIFPFFFFLFILFSDKTPTPRSTFQPDRVRQ